MVGSRRTAADRLAELEAKKRQLSEQIAALSARTRERQRKDDDRRKILLGSIVLADLPTNRELATYIRDRLPSVMRNGDERLFPDILGKDAS